MKQHYKTLSEIQNDLLNGIVIYWASELYKVHFVDALETSNKYSLTGSKVIRISCTTNYFGSLISESEITSCYKKVG